MRGLNWTRWRWLDDGVLPLAASVAYAAWAHPAFAAYVRDPVTGEPSSGYSFWLCLITLLVATTAGRIAARTYRGPAIAVAGGFVAMGTTLLAVVFRWRAQLGTWPWNAALIRAVVAACVGAAFLWWRGLRMANADHHEETASTFVIGTLALSGMVAIGQHAVGNSGRGAVGAGLWLVLLLAVAFVGLMLLFLAFTARVDQSKLLSGGEAVFALAVVILSGALGLPTSPGALSGPVLLFVFASMVTRSLLGLSWVLNSQRGQGGARLHVETGWVAVVVGVAAVVLGLGLALGQVLTPDAVRTALRWLSTLFLPVLAIVAYVVFGVAWTIARALIALLSRLGLQLPEPPEAPPEDVEGMADWALSLPPAARRSLGVLVIVAALVLVGWILYRVARRLRAPDGGVGDAVERRRSTFSLAALRARIGEVLARWRRGSGPFAPLDARSTAQRAVRLAYRRVLRRAIARGAPRAPAQSPRAYAERLGGLCPEEEGALNALTAAYEGARYGAHSPEEAVRAAEEAALRVDAALRNSGRVIGKQGAPSTWGHSGDGPT